MTAATPSMPASSNANSAWKPAETFETGIRKTVQWYLDNPGWVERVQSGAYREWVERHYKGEAQGRMKILLFGKGGQVGWELQRSLAPLGEVIALGSAGNGDLAGDFRQPEAVAATVRAVRPDVVVNAAAYTAVDKAEADPDTARLVNAVAPGAIAREAASLRRAPASTTPPTTCSTAAAPGPGSRRMPPARSTCMGPASSQARPGSSDMRGRYLILRTSWVYGARGGNFAKTMMRLARQRDRLSVVADQIGAPTGADLLADLTAHLVRAESANPQLRGIYHAAAAGEVSWHGYARFVLERAAAAGVALKAGPDAVDPVPTSSYPTPARRPHNSRLDTSKLRRATGLVLPSWQAGVARMVAEVISVEEDKA